jgi:SWI/SNF-related matrix-associated actin-dependent regulator 1 of chromatin subfamily A
MSELRVPSESHAGRSISPASKRQRTADGYSSRDGSGYNSAVDSGDELFDHLTTPQTSKHFTQPTQLLDRNDAQSSPGSAVSPEVQVPVSSPFRQQQASAAMLQSPTSKVSRVASLMAPAGTAFRAPVIPTQSSMVKKSVVIDLSDDDGPHYNGGSSDDDGQSRAGIKPSTFVSRPGNTSLSASRTDSDNAGTGGLGRPPSKFNDIVSNYRYNSDKATTIGNSSGSKSSSSILSAYLSAGGNRSSGTGSMAGALHSKPHVQSKPSRAMPVDEVRTSDASNELEMRRKIFRLKQMNPAISVVQARNALVSCKGSVDDAAAQLMAPPIEISDDENETSRPQMHALDTQMKHQLKAPIKSIQERYSSTQHAKKAAQPAATPEKKPRKRLQQGRRQPSPSSSAVRSPPVPAPSPPKPVHILSDQDSADSGIASESEDDPLLEGRLLNFINKCKAEDLADLANVKVGVAELILAQRPFKNLDAARRVTDGTTLKSGKRSNKAPIGEKVIQTAVDMWSGYEAVDALVAKCEQLGKPLTEEISKWGFDVFGAAKTGELEMVSLDDGSDSPRDSGIGTPSSKAASTNGDAGEDDIRTASQHKKHRQVTFLKKPALMNPDITLKDYQVVGLNWLALLYKHKLSCILADDMGLGKTCQVIAFLSHIVETGVSGPHLVIVPASTLENWLREFQLFSPNLVVEPYYGMPILGDMH